MLGKNAGTTPQSGSMLLEAVIVLGMIATFTPLLYKHVADRRADIENINRANTLIYLQQKTENFLKDPANITALVGELGHNQHKEIYPSELGIGDNFDVRYIIGIRREDEQNKPVLKAMIIDTVNTGSDLRAARVAELIGVSAGIYTAVDPDAAWGINGLWSEPLERYFNTTNIPTGAVAVTTEYNKEKYRVNISDILVDSDLDLGEFDLTAEQINAINIAAQNGTIGELIATTEVASPKLVSSGSICFRKNGEEDCIDSWEGLGGQDSSDLMLVQMCNSGLTEMCMLAFAKDLNTSCSKVDAVYDQFGATYPTPKIYTLTYGTGGTYGGEIRVKCEGTSFVVENISTSTLTNTVEQVGDTAFGITQPGWYQVTLMGEAGWTSGNTDVGSGGILIANKNFAADAIITIKGVKGNVYNSNSRPGAGVLFWDTLDTPGAPILGAGGGRAANTSGSGIIGGSTNVSGFLNGYGWNESLGGNTTICSDTTCGSAAADGGSWYNGGNYAYGGSGSSQSECYAAGYSSCITIMGGNATNSGSPYVSYLNSKYGNWGTNPLTGGKGYASIVYCGTSEADCPVACGSDNDCPSNTPYCSNGICTTTQSCTTSSDCTVASHPYCVSNICSATCTANSQCPSATPYCFAGLCSSEQPCLIASNCPSSKPYCNSGACSTTQILTCGSTNGILETATWVAGWANCTSCPVGQFKKYQAWQDSGLGICAYPVTYTAGCVSIPALNSYTTLPTGIYHTGSSCGTISNAKMWRRQVNITCNGKNEEWDLVGPFIEWWEAQEVCAKLGKTLPVNKDILTGGCSEGARWSLIKNATAVGTGQTLTAVSGISTISSWDSSTGNTTSSYHLIYTNQGGANSCDVWHVSLATGDPSYYHRSPAYYYSYALCGPAN